MIRCTFLFFILLVVWLTGFGWAAGVPWNAPILPRELVALAGTDFRVRFGTGANSANGLAVSGLAADGTGLQTAPLDHLRASDFPVLTYRFEDFPDTLELSLMFRRADMPDDLQMIPIPASGGGTASVDLAAFADWKGEIIELGFAEYAAPQLVPPSEAKFLPFQIEYVQLKSHSWSQLFLRSRSDWLSYRPWTLRSINTLGQRIDFLAESSMQLLVTLCALVSLIAAWAILRWPRRRIAQATLLATCAVWVLLDLRWLDDFAAKHRVIEKLYAGRPWQARAQLQPDEDTLAAAAEISRLASAQGVNRVLVLSDSTYTLLRLIYFLLPLNVAPMSLALSAAPGTSPPRDALIAVFGSTWDYDEARGILSNGATAISVIPVYAKGDLLVLRAREVAP